MNTRLKIDIAHGLLEVEGNEKFVKTIYDEFKHKILEKGVLHPSEDKPKQHEERVHPKIEKEKKVGKQKRKTVSYSVVKDLDLSAKNRKQSLRDFFKSKAPSSDMERNVVFTYYLQKIAEVEGITVNHIYTCYKDVSDVKVPTNLQQSLLNSAHHKGWLDTSNFSDIKVATPGENFVEHDLPKKEGMGK